MKTALLLLSLAASPLLFAQPQPPSTPPFSPGTMPPGDGGGQR